MNGADSNRRRYEHLTRIRVADPRMISRAASERRPRPGPHPGRQNFIIGADHPARLVVTAP